MPNGPRLTRRVPPSNARRVGVAAIAFAVLLPLLTVISTPEAQALNPATEPRDEYSQEELAEVTWQTNGPVYAVLPIGNTVYIGGEFTALVDGNGDSVTRNNLAAIDLLTGEPTSFNPNMNNRVFALTESPDGKTLYVGGNFTKSGNKARKRIAAFDLPSGSLTSFNPPGADKAVRAVATDGSLLYIGGLFDQVGETGRAHLAAYDLTTDDLDPAWKPLANNEVKALVVDSNRIWVGGYFTRINGFNARGIAAIDAGNGVLIATEHTTYPVIALAVHDDQVFVAGGGPGGRAAAFDRISGEEQWVVQSNGNFQAVAADDNFAYFGGHHTRIADGLHVSQLTRLSLDDGTVDMTWLPYVNGQRGVNTAASDGVNIYIGGDFSFVSRERQGGFAMFTDPAGTDLGGGGLDDDPPVDDPPVEDPPVDDPADPPAATRPKLQRVTLLDNDENGLVDTIRVAFDSDLADCAWPCTDGWSITDVPSGGSMRGVSTSGNIANVRLNEGTGDPDTSVGALKVRLRDTTSIRGIDGGIPRFLRTTPLDGAAPIPTRVRRTNAGTGGLAESGDTFVVEWSEPVSPDSLPTVTDVKITDPTNTGKDRLRIDGITDGNINLGSDDWLVCPNGECARSTQAVFADSAVTLSRGGRVLIVTLSECSGNCGGLVSGPEATITYTAPASITDEAGNAAVGSFEKTFKLF